MKPKKYCAHAGCNTLIEYDQRYCTRHEKAYSLHRSRYHRENDTGARFRNNKRWRDLSKYKRAKDPLCEVCLHEKEQLLAQGRLLEAKEYHVRQAEHVHHIQSIATRPDLAYTYGNLMSICAKHHRIEDGKERNM